MPTPRQKAEQFLARAHEFKLGNLPTEEPHPKTKHLSQLAQTHLGDAYRLFHELDLHVFHEVKRQLPRIELLHRAIQQTLQSGQRVFFCGCGATGRLALTLEYLWREAQAHTPAQESVVSFMAGGDYALIRSIEGFEDHPEYGARQLDELGFVSGDLLISVTEGGETPFVIGATEHAAIRSTRRPWFLYCNPEDLLIQTLERSRRVIQNPQIESLNLYVGPMALSGSTRLQATTALYLAAGSALLAVAERSTPQNLLDSFESTLKQADYSRLSPWTHLEEKTTPQGVQTLYRASDLACTVANDLTERAPTFSLSPLDQGEQRQSWVALEVIGTPTSEIAWTKLLGRTPRGLHWPELQGQYDNSQVYRFNLAGQLGLSAHTREALTLDLLSEDQALLALWSGGEARFTLHSGRGFERHLLLKLLLNAHSTLMMGRLGRYLGNVMVYVRPSNYKLIDRSIRAVEWLARHEGIQTPSYEALAHLLFEVIEDLPSHEPAVLKTFERIKSGSTALTS